MKNLHKAIIILIVIIIAILAVLYVNGGTKTINKDGDSYNTTLLTDELTLDMNNWNYDEENDIYYQIGIVYCTSPATTDYESLAIYVPGKYMDATKNSNGTYTCTLNTENKVGNYTSETAPIVLPVDTPGYSAHEAPTSYSANEVKDYLDSGFVYVSAGCRGRDNGDNYTGGAPWGVTDLKASILYLKFNDENLPGDTEKIFTFGMSGGGAQSAIVGVSGNSELYTPYLESIGAALVNKDGNELTDDVCGSMCWCPITNLDYADEAYEWYMGQYSTTDTRANDTWTSALSLDMAGEYATYINNLKLKSPDGTELTLENSSDGIYTSGSYYDYQISVIEESLNNFLNDTTFPYTPSNSMSMGEISYAQMSDISGDIQDAIPTDSMDNAQMGEMPSGNMGGDMQLDSFMGSDSSSSNVTYNTPQEYIDSLNTNGTWITYDSSTNTAKITSIEDFVNHCKSPSKSVGAFDDLDRSQAENKVFGNQDENALHFDKTMTSLLENNSDEYSQYSDYDSSYISEYKDDLTKTDLLNNSMEYRENMYNPMYYLNDYYNGSSSSDVAKYWRINSGIEQGDTALSTESNLALALNQSNKVESVEFTTVWNQAHTEAERTDTSTENFINWVNECLN